MPVSPSSAQAYQKKSRSNKPKLFECKGFGDCQMVFTRSEHLARHTRKHTGEKPYLCIVPGCSRRFSRFDNMMQHTQTHKATRQDKHTLKNIRLKETTPESTLDSSDEESIKHTMSVEQLLDNPPLKELHLTQDEFEALQGLGQFRHTPIFMDSFRDLASVVYIEPNPQPKDQ